MAFYGLCASLVDEWLLKLDDKVSKYYPVEYAATDKRDITLSATADSFVPESGSGQAILPHNDGNNDIQCIKQLLIDC
ncbi:MAG TPA: hypothetical protein VF622_04595 [Segetibacter sp.]|jgi:hypothetical protein